MENIDTELLIQQVSDVIKYAQGLRDDTPMNGVRAIIEKWRRNKEYFIHFIGGLIYEYPEPVTFELSKTEKVNKLADLINYIYENYGENTKLRKFLNWVHTEEFFNNKLEDNYEDENGNIIVSAGTKVIKAFKYFEENNHILSLAQDKASELIQQNKVTGTLCFSVHPLDYLSISENTHKWRSCHSLDGDFATGNLNYMVDSSTVVCYLKSKEDAILPHFPENVPWNSKKWRMLLFFSQDYYMMFHGRQYPFVSEAGNEFVNDKLMPLVCKLKKPAYWELNSGSKCYNSCFNDLYPVGRSLIERTRLIKDGQNTYHYNDLLSSTVYTNLKYSYYYSYPSLYPSGETSEETTKFIIGEDCPCPVCGGTNSDYEEGNLCCEECRDHYIGESYNNAIECGICGNITSLSQMFWLPYSEIQVCGSCFVDLPHCDCCGVRDTEEYIKIDTETNLKRCPRCRQENRTERLWIYG